MKKKKLTTLALAGVLGVASLGMMGCGKEDAKPYIQVSGLDTTYIQNEEINLDGAKILYYSDKNDTTADKITLTESMVANFDTETTGEKKMKIIWNNFELEVDYSVISTTQFINIYNTAYNNLLNVEYVHSDVIVTRGEDVVYGSSNVSNNKLYAYQTVDGATVFQEWREQYNEEWYRYKIDGEDETRECVTVTSNNIMEWGMNNFIGSSSNMDESVLEYIDGISYDIDGTKIILSIKVFDSEYNETNITEFIIENERFVECNAKVQNSSGEITTITTSKISYNTEDVEMVELPSNVVWEDVE